MVEFAGWRMPVQYSGILEEVRAVRTKAGLFDLSHMGRAAVAGPGAEDLLQKVVTNDVSKIPPGGIRYALILDEAGMTQDDVLVYRQPAGEDFFLVLNASNTGRDLGILREQARAHEARVEDLTEALAMLALQGPASQRIASRVVEEADLSTLRYYHWTRARIAGVEGSISRTGYTGEDGFEVYFPAGDAERVWAALMAAGEEDGLVPVGLGARDTLRLEAGMALYGHEIHEGTNPLEAGLGWAVKFTKDFTGRQALERVREQGLSRKLAGLVTSSPRVPRQGYPLVHGDHDVGSVASGTKSPTLGTNIATGYLPAALAEPGTEVQFRVRDRLEPARVVALPFYKRPRQHPEKP